jgi:hypothetical protein
VPSQSRQVATHERAQRTLHQVELPPLALAHAPERFTPILRFAMGLFREVRAPHCLLDGLRGADQFRANLRQFGLHLRQLGLGPRVLNLDLRMLRPLAGSVSISPRSM